MKRFSRPLCAVMVLFLMLAAGTPAFAQATTAISGTVTTPDGAPIAFARVSLQGPVRENTATDSSGHFEFKSLQPGAYAITASKGGFSPTTLANVEVAGSKASVSLQLSPTSLSSITEIANVVTGKRGEFNTSAAASAYIPQTLIADRGAVQVTRVLDEIPGVATARTGTFNAAVPGSTVSPNLRGALDYEKQTLIDGHPIVNGRFGDYPIGVLNAFLLDGVEITKGPGANAPEINYAIGGTVNFRTLEPTARPSGDVVFGYDNFGGSYSNVRFTGTAPNGKISYAVDYATYGTRGPLSNYPTYVTLAPGTIVNGYGTVTKKPYSPSPSAPNVVGAPANGVPTLVACCQTVNSDFLNHAGLAKLRYRLSDTTVATVSYVGIYSQYDGAAASLAQFPAAFAPGAGYTAPLSSGTVLLNAKPLLPDTRQLDNQPIFQADVRTALRNDTILARYYAAALDRFTVDPLNDPSANYTTAPFTLYGTATVNNAPVVFNGTQASLTIPTPYNHAVEQDQLRGESFEYDHPVASNVLSFGLDRTSYLSNAYTLAANGRIVTQVPAGSRQDFTTYLLRGVFNLNAQTTVTASNYYNVYRTLFTPGQNPDGSFLYQTATHVHDDPRLGITYRPNANASLRFAVGSSVAPPYIGLVDGLTTAPVYTPGATALVVQQNSGNLLPETAFGYDAGGDVRLPTGAVLSVDGYLTNLRNQFVGAFIPDGTFTVPNSTTQIPVYANTTVNLAKARFEGIELTLRKDPSVGIGYLVTGTLQRAYPYDVPADFYTIQTPNGPVAYGTNLGVVPGLNYVADNKPFAFSFNGISNKSEAYSLGYAELHWRAAHGQYFSIGTNYYGANNTYNVPAFFVGNATYRQPLGANFTLQVSADNILGSYPSKYINAYAGLGTPLVNGKLGLNNQIPVGPAAFRFSISRSF